MLNFSKRLRSCSATIAHADNVELLLTDTGETATFQDALVLKSYDTIVAIIAGYQLYLMPAWDCSVTTQSHVRKFVEDNSDLLYQVRPFVYPCSKHFHDEMKTYGSAADVRPAKLFAAY